MKKIVVLLLLAGAILAGCGSKTSTTTTKQTDFQPKVQSTIVVSGGVSVLTSTLAHITVSTGVTISGNYFVIGSPKWNVSWSMILPYTFSGFTVSVVQSGNIIDISDAVATQNEIIERLILPGGFTVEDYINSLVKTGSNCEVVEVQYEGATHTSGSLTYQIVPLQADPNEQDSGVTAYKPATTPDQCGEYTSHEGVNRFIITNPQQPSSIFIITTKPKTHIGVGQIEWPLTFRIN